MSERLRDMPRRLTTRLTTRLAHAIGLVEPPLLGASVAPHHTFRWDLDKTYLRTEFDSLRDLLKAGLEEATDKVAYPGAAAVLRSLHQPEHRICIVSGSPTHMRTVLAAKLALDGVHYDEFTLKNNARNILRGRFRSLRAQIPYKLPALLASRCAGAPAPRESMFGDDAEADAIVYCLYADIVADRITQFDLGRVLEAARAYPDDAARTLELARQAPRGGGVDRIFIHLDRRSPPSMFRAFGPRLVPVFNYFQIALVLYSDGVLDARQVLFVAKEMLDSGQFDVPQLANSLQDLMYRGRVDRPIVLRLASEAGAAAESVADASGNLPPYDRIASAFRERVDQLAGFVAPLTTSVPLLDYVRLVDEEHVHRRRRETRV